MSAAAKIASSVGDSVLKGRRGTIYNLQNQDVPVRSLGELRARRRFATSRYFISPAGILKVLVLILFVTGGTLFLTSDSCPDAPDWYSWLYPIACLIAFVSTAFLYLMFMLGMAEDNPRLWINLDLAVTLTEALTVTVVSIFTITSCSSEHFRSSVLGPLGLTGAALMAVSAAATYIMWRYRDQDSPPGTPAPDEQQQPRRSLFI